MRRTARRIANRTCRRLLERLEPRALLHGAEVLGSVFLDADGDGLRSTGEMGIPGVVMALAPSGSSDSAAERTAITADDGSYSFHELNPGSYQLTKRQSPALIEAAAADEAIASLTVADEQVLTDNHFGELGLRAEFISIRWFLASSPSPHEMLRQTIADSEELAGNAELAAAIRNGGEAPPDDSDDDDEPPPADDDDDDHADDENQPFEAVTTGPFDAAHLLGERTDLVAGAPPITRDHVETSVDFSGYSNPPTYGPHHAFITDDDGNSITPRPTGVYTTEQPDEDLIHNLEHGHVWISYNPALLGSDDLTALRQFVTAGGNDTGVILTPRSANDSAIAVASWARLLKLNSFDAGQIRDFVNTNRGHAPEGFIPSGQKAAGSASENLDDGLPH